MAKFQKHKQESFLQSVRIHIKGKPVIIGHVVENTFFIVFLDKDHRFWLTKRERQN